MSSLFLFSLPHATSSDLTGTTTPTSDAFSLSPCTQIWSTTLAFLNWFSSFSTATYSPCASLNKFFLRSMMRSAPEGSSSPMSPVWNQPSESACAPCHDVAQARQWTRSLVKQLCRPRGSLSLYHAHCFANHAFCMQRV